MDTAHWGACGKGLPNPSTRSCFVNSVLQLLRPLLKLGVAPPPLNSYVESLCNLYDNGDQMFVHKMRVALSSPLEFDDATVFTTDVLTQLGTENPLLLDPFWIRDVSFNWTCPNCGHPQIRSFPSDNRLLLMLSAAMAIEDSLRASYGRMICSECQQEVDRDVQIHASSSDVLLLYNQAGLRDGADKILEVFGYKYRLVGAIANSGNHNLTLSLRNNVWLEYDDENVHCVPRFDTWRCRPCLQLMAYQRFEESSDFCPGNHFGPFILTLFCWRHSASNCSVAGSFTAWAKGPPMEARGDSFYFSILLAPGVYEYKFLLGEEDRWTTDFDQPHLDNSNNFVCVTYPTSGENALSKWGFWVSIGVCADYPLAKNVRIAGDFTLWELVPCVLNPYKGVWECRLVLPPGLYLWKLQLEAHNGTTTWVCSSYWPRKLSSDGYENNYFDV
ncbi:hypothetical protein Pelo_14993 [Pelomyxa schiedti]|nr:hypothetical protein Pelo_14993 [Pelomyxa schiedti]